MNQAEIGIIGGTGLGEALLKGLSGREVLPVTPYGTPSGPIVLTEWEGVSVAFLARHGRGHPLNPSNVPYRANLYALKTLGVSAIFAGGAVGSLREEIQPGHLVICDQVIDKTFRRVNTFFDEGPVTHVSFAEPFCPRLRAVLVHAGREAPAVVHHAGTYICMEGPQFSTRAESNMHRQWGGDLIGMTCMPEAKLAREAEICYALVALVTDYDCWRPGDVHRHPDELLRDIQKNLERTTLHAVALIREGLKSLKAHVGSCGCREALKLAIWSDRSQLDSTARQRLEPLIGRYMNG